MVKEENIEEKETEDEEDGVEETEDDNVGIFDEDLNVADEAISDFSIGDTILSTAPTTLIRQGHNLEELAERQRIEDSKWKEAHDVEEDSGKDFYGKSQKADDLYQNGNNNQDSYNGRSGDLYSGEKNKRNVYDVEKINVKSYGALVDNRRSGRSMLEVAGFEDKEKQKQREIRGHVKYEGREE